MDELGLRTLAVASAVAAHGSFRGAAHALDMSPSSVSHMVASLEKRLGILLFLRNTRSVSLTEAGQAFLTRVRPALGEITAAVAQVNELRDRPAGLIRLNASDHGAARILPLVVAFMQAYPDIRVELATEGRLVDIVAEGFDAGLRLVSVVSGDMVALPLGIDEALLIVAAPAYLRQHGTPQTPGDLLRHACIRSRLPSGAPLRWDVAQGHEQELVDVSGRLIVGTTLLATQAAAAGAGLAYVEASEAAPYLADGRLQQVLAAWTPPFAGHALYYPRQRLPSAAFRAFIEFCRERLRDHAGAPAAQRHPLRNKRRQV